MPAGGLLVHERLGAEVVLRRAAFDGVGGQRERRAAETDERDASFELAAQEPDRLEHVAERFGLERRQARDVGRRPYRVLDRRSLALDEVELEAHRREGQQQVGKEDRGVEVDDVERLERDDDGELRLAAELEQGVLLPERAVLRKVAAGLTHEPDGRGVHRLRAGTPGETDRTRGPYETIVRASVSRSSRYIGLNRIDAPSERSSFCMASARK